MAKKLNLRLMCIKRQINAWVNVNSNLRLTAKMRMVYQKIYEHLHQNIYSMFTLEMFSFTKLERRN